MEELKALHSEHTEKAALGSMFLDREAAQMGKGSLVADDFYTPLYRTVFEAMQAVEAVDVTTVWNQLEKSGQAERVGMKWLADIVASQASSVNLRLYIEELKRLSYLRRVMAAGRELVQAALQQEQGDIENILQSLQGDGYGTASITTLADATEKHIRNLAEIRSSGKDIIGLTTGFYDLDSSLGGMRKGDSIILAARPSMGKSALALDIARNAQKSMTDENERVVIFSLEMPAESLGNRGYTSEYLVDNDRFAVGSNDEAWLETLREVEQNSEAYEKGAGRIIINDTSAMTVEKIRAACHGYQTQGIKIGLVVIDYLQLIQAKAESRTREIGEISRGLKLLAKHLDCPLLVLSQLSRSCELRADHRPMLSDLRDSGDIEQDADVTLFLYRDEYYFPDTESKNQAELIIGKQRNGPTGTVRLTWMPRSTTFRNMERSKKTSDEMPEGW